MVCKFGLRCKIKLSFFFVSKRFDKYFGPKFKAVKDVDGIRTLSFLKNLGHKKQQATQKANPQIQPTVIDKNLLSSLTVDSSLLSNIKDALNNLSG